MAGGSDKNWVLEGPTVWQKNFNFAFSENVHKSEINMNIIYQVIPHTGVT